MPTHLISLSPFYVTLQLVPFLFVLLFYSLFCLCSQNKTKQKIFKSHCHPSSDTKLRAPPVHYILWSRALCSLQQGVNLDSSISACCLHFLEMGVLELLLLALSSAQGSQRREKKRETQRKDQVRGWEKGRHGGCTLRSWTSPSNNCCSKQHLYHGLLNCKGQDSLRAWL